MLFVIILALGLVDPETGYPVRENMHGYTECTVPPGLPAGPGQWTGNGPWGGNLKALVAAPDDNSTVIAACGFSMASDAGGVWRSTDGGQTWSATELTGIQVNDACAAPPSTFYAGTRTGLYVSWDGGQSWQTVPGMASSYVIGIGASHHDPDLLIAGLSSNNGIRRSTDGGQTWHEVGLSTGFMKGFGFDPDNPETLYVAMSGLSQPLYRSLDGGASWSPMGPSGSGWGLLTAPFGSGETIILTHDHGFYMSNDYGATWNLAVSGGSYAPAATDGVNLYAPVNAAGGVYESTDGGSEWTLNTSGITASFWQAGCVASSGYLAGHYGGIYRTDGPGGTYQVSQEGVGNAFVHSVSYISSTGTLFAGGEHHGLWKSTDAGSTWSIIIPGPGDWTIYDIAPKSDLLYQGSVMYLATMGGVYRSDDYGDSWSQAGFPGTQVSSVAFDPSDPDRAWAGLASSGVHYTTDGGQTWTPGTGFPFALFPSVELMDSDGAGLRVLVSFQQMGSGVYYSDDGGVTYTSAAVPGSYHPAISARSGQDGMVYLATDGGIHRSWDRGVTWEPCPGSSGLSWAVLGELDDNVFNGTGSTGVRRSPDRGDTWELLNNGIENRCVWDIAYGEGPGQLFAGLRGFGVVEYTDEGLGIGGPAPSALAVSAAPNPSRGSVNITVQGGADAPVAVSVFDTAGRLMATLDAREGEALWTPGTGTPAGLYLVRAAGGNHAVTARVVLLQ